MARNSSGTYSLPSSAGNPVVSGTTVSSTWANQTLADLATEVTDSLSRTGKGGMTAPLRTADGNATAPAQSFTSETGSGWFRNAAGDLRLAILGTYRLAVTAATTTVNNALSVASTIFASGTVTATGALISKAITSGNLAQVKAPDTLAAGYELTLPAALPGSTLPVHMSSAGVLSTSTLSRGVLPTVGQQTATTSGSFTTTSTSAVDVTGASVSITTSGRPVIVIVQPYGGAGDAINATRTAASGNLGAYLLVKRDSTALATQVVGTQTVPAISVEWSFPLGLSVLDAPAAGTYTYKLQAYVFGANMTTTIGRLTISAYEL